MHQRQMPLDAVNSGKSYKQSLTYHPYRMAVLAVNGQKIVLVFPKRRCGGGSKFGKSN